MCVELCDNLLCSLDVGLRERALLPAELGVQGDAGSSASRASAVRRRSWCTAAAFGYPVGKFRKRTTRQRAGYLRREDPLWGEQLHPVSTHTLLLAFRISLSVERSRSRVRICMLTHSAFESSGLFPFVKGKAWVHSLLP